MTSIRKRTYPAAAILTIVATAFAASPAGAATGGELTVGAKGGTNVAVGDVLTAPLSATSVFTTSSGNVSCTSGSFSAKDLTNPVETGTAEATESVTALHFVPASCTSTISGSSGIVSIDLNSAASAKVVDGTTDTTLTLQVTKLDEKVTLSTALGNVVCDFGTAGTVVHVNGRLSDTTNSVTFNKAPVNKISGSFVCPSSGTFSAVFGPITDTTQAGKKVFVN